MKKLFFGGNIYTMAKPEMVDAVIVEDDKILQIGSFEDLFDLSENCQLVDLKGKTMIPAFIDPHSHFSGVANSSLQVSLDGVGTFEEMKSRIEKFIETNKIPKDKWVNASNWDNNLFPNASHPSIEEIDSISPNNPLTIHHKSGHMGLMNSLALNKLDITPQTESPDGGKIEIKDGKLTGYLEENAFITYIQKAPMATGEDLIEGFKKAQDVYLSYGITTLQDGMAVTKMLPLYDLLLSKDILKIDLVAYVSPQDFKDCKIKYGKLPKEKHFKIGGIKIFLDGSPQGRTAWMRTPYLNEKEYCGYGTMKDEEVLSAMELAAQENTQLIAHCNGDAAADQFLRCLQITEEKYPDFKKNRPVIIHGQLMGKDQMKKAKELGAMVSFFIAHIYHWGDIHIKNFGIDRAKDISPAGSALSNEVKFTFHQDSPVINPNMLETIWCAVCRETKNGVKLSNEEKISVYDAVCAVTKNSAYQYFMEKKIGTIENGKKADFAVLSDNIFKADSEKLKDIKVVSTYKNGECVYKI